MLILTQAPTTWPVTTAEAFAQCGLHLTHDAQHEDLIERMIKAASAAIGREAGLALSPCAFEQRFDCWPRAPWPHVAGLVLGVAPVREVTGVTYLDADGASQTLGAASWYFEPSAAGGAVFLNEDVSAPDLAPRPGAVRVAFTAGCSDPAASEADPRLEVAEEHRQAILLTIGAWFADREVGEIPAGARNILNLPGARVYR